jgi:hypothetical protein
MIGRLPFIECQKNRGKAPLTWRRYYENLSFFCPLVFYFAPKFRQQRISPHKRRGDMNYLTTIPNCRRFAVSDDRRQRKKVPFRLFQGPITLSNV